MKFLISAYQKFITIFLYKINLVVLIAIKFSKHLKK